MPKRVIHVNKKTGVSYVYEYIPYWDKDKKQGRNKQVCIGKIDPVSGETIPSKRLVSAPSLQQAAAIDPDVTATAQIVGPSLILDFISERLGLGKLLKSCFPEAYQQIMAMAYYLVAEDGPLSYCSTWCNSHAPVLASSLSSQRISETLKSITTDQKQTFLDRWCQWSLKFPPLWSLKTPPP